MKQIHITVALIGFIIVATMLWLSVFSYFAQLPVYTKLKASLEKSTVKDELLDWCEHQLFKRKIMLREEHLFPKSRSPSAERIKFDDLKLSEILKVEIDHITLVGDAANLTHPVCVIVHCEKGIDILIAKNDHHLNFSELEYEKLNFGLAIHRSN
jgi:hypothetical protein